MRREIFGLGLAADRASAALCCSAARPAGGPRAVGGRGRRARARAVRDRDRPADPRGARRPAAALRPARLRDPAVPGPRRSCRCWRCVPLLRAGARRSADRPSAADRGRQRRSARSPRVVLAGRYLLNPFFRLLAATGAREVMTAAALLVVLGAALLMQDAGLSMAMGAFLAGVLLAEFELPPRARSRHRAVPRHAARRCSSWASACRSTCDRRARELALLARRGARRRSLLKAALIAVLFRALRLAARARRCAPASLLAPAGEFAFVLLPLGGCARHPDAAAGAASSRRSRRSPCCSARSPPSCSTRVLGASQRAEPRARSPSDFADARAARVLVIGFGRFGQIVDQCCSRRASTSR